jgi:hypothetical protein
MVGAALLQLERNGALVRAHAEVLSKRLDTADIVRDAMLRQPSCREAANFLTFIDLPHP